MLLVLGFRSVIDLLTIFDAAELAAWIKKNILNIWLQGMILGLILSVGVTLSRRYGQPRRPFIISSTTLGSIGGLAISIKLMTQYKVSIFASSWESALTYVLPFTLLGSLIGYWTGRMTSPPQLISDAQRNESRRRKLFRWSVGLSVAFLADGLFMAWALNEGGYAPLGYAQVSFLPVFMPALLASLIMLGIYTRGVRRGSLSVRRSEWVFFVVFALAVAAKAVVFVLNDR